MPTRLFTSTFRHSTVLVERIGAIDLPATLRSEAARVVAAHDYLARAATEVTVAKGNEASLRKALRDAMAALDAEVDELASELVGARLGARTAPFAAFGLQGARVRGGAQRKLDGVGELLDRIGSRDAASLARAIASARAAEQALREVLASLTLPGRRSGDSWHRATRRRGCRRPPSRACATRQRSRGRASTRGNASWSAPFLGCGSWRSGARAHRRCTRPGRRAGGWKKRARTSRQGTPRSSELRGAAR